jgi:hypothetical protein
VSCGWSRVGSGPPGSSANGASSPELKIDGVPKRRYSTDHRRDQYHVTKGGERTISGIARTESLPASPA